MNQRIVLDTTISEPGLNPGEIDMLFFCVDRSRAQFAWKCRGLDADGLRRRFPPSAMTIGGLVKHMAMVEDWYTTRVTADRMPEPWRSIDWDADPDWPWHSAAEDSPEEIYGLWQRAVDRSRTLVPTLVADGGLDQLAKLHMGSDEEPNVRCLLFDLHDEYARHVGHADLFREAIDGLVGEDPPQPPAAS